MVTVMNGMEYRSDGQLGDDTGHRWRRVADWVEPLDADRLIADGTPLLVQWDHESPHQVRPERYPGGVRLSMLTRAEARRYRSKAQVPSVMVGELWRSEDAGDCLLFVEQGPHPRRPDELA
jgi:hypothetical protein